MRIVFFMCTNWIRNGDSMLARDIMTTGVITGTSSMSIHDVAKLMSEKGVSAVPIVDQDDHVIGMVSEGDLLHRHEIGTERRRSWWLDMVASTNQDAGDYIKSHSTNVADVMVRDVISVIEATPVADIALLLENRRIKRVPVLRDGKLVGIVSRANLVHALATTIDVLPSGAEAEDGRIRDKLLEELRRQRWAEVSPTNILVKDGVVHFWCSYISEREKRALMVAAESVPGVRRVEDHMVRA